jgi:hypothetical protein
VEPSEYAANGPLVIEGYEDDNCAADRIREPADFREIMKLQLWLNLGHTSPDRSKISLQRVGPENLIYPSKFFYGGPLALGEA